MKRNRKNDVFAVLSREFKITFDLMLTSPATHEWGSVLHFTTGGDYPRIPAVFISRENKLHVSMQDLAFFGTTILTTNTVFSVELSQTWVEGKVMKIKMKLV